MDQPTIVGYSLDDDIWDLPPFFETPNIAIATLPDDSVTSLPNTDSREENVTQILQVCGSCRRYASPSLYYNNFD